MAMVVIFMSLKQCCLTAYSMKTVSNNVTYNPTIHLYYSETSPLRIQVAIVTSKI